MEAAFLFVPHLSLALSLTHTRSFIQAHIFIMEATAPESFDEFAFQTLEPISLLLCYFVVFFSSFLTVFASFHPWAFYYTAKVTFMSPQCLKPNTPVCQEGTDV